ncbi:phosphotransferase family protein [Paractinoplanes hotanensis]|uniref:Aminoglycoside phosphotransferase family protein n=1 Tax=Paractinoplanes hotanensis TaxID=2906497 RepID=A0ABT0Y3S5_9ACTN|nr:phosphotransferase [Actinoplanes hotanensis]MCM4079939.1 aminoglycoside phosphotransferase family protein [Actinoplanes hotanensis]
MSPGPAAVLLLDDGRRVFVKAVSRTASEPSYRFYRREAVALAALPAEAPAPVLVGSVEVGGWCALVMSVAEGVPAGPPWSDDGVRLVNAACEVVASLRAPAVVPPIGQLITDLDGWERLAAGEPALLDDWERRHVTVLAGLAAGWPEWTTGTTLVHQDVRADNAMVDLPAGRAVLVDWSFGCAGASWLDRARLAADIVGAGHREGPAAGLRSASRILAGLPDEAASFVAALAGMWCYRSTLPAPPGHPTLRPWQRERARLIRPLLASLI